jgi:CHASE3 domain sensor protein
LTFPTALVSGLRSLRLAFRRNLRIWLGFFLSAGLILFAGLVSERMSASVRVTIRAEAQSYQVLGSVQSLSDDLSAMNAEVLRHLSAGNESAASAITVIQAETFMKWRELEVLTRNAQDEHRTIAQFRTLFEARIALLAEAARAHDSPGTRTNDPVAMLNLAHPNMYEFRQKVDQIQSVESQRMRLLASAESARAVRASATIIGSSLMAVLLLSLEAFWLHRQKQRTELAEEAKRQSDLRLNLALTSAAVGTWTWDIENLERYWDSETYRLFGQTPGTLSGDMDSLLKLIHPEDRNRAWLRPWTAARTTARPTESSAPMVRCVTWRSVAGLGRTRPALQTR